MPPVNQTTAPQLTTDHDGIRYGHLLAELSMSWQDRFASALQQRKETHLLRQRQTLQSPQSTHVKCGSAQLLNFCSNDYLGLANTGGEDLARAAQEWQFGSGASHLVCGHTRAHHDLEDALAEFSGYPRALLFSTGYMANVGVISALAQRGDLILQDKLNHASLLDGAQLSRAKMIRYRHCDYQQLNELLEDATGDCLVVSDSIFSMDGDLADVARLAELSQQHNALLMIDDAHGIGVLGQHGHGVREHFNLSQDALPVYIGTLGKALGGYGAFVAGSEELIEYLIQFSRSYIYTTAMPPAVAQAMLGNLERAKDNTLREALTDRIEQFRSGAKARGLPLMASESPVQPLLTGASDRALRISDRLKNQGIWISAIRPPTVPQGEARLRVTLTAAHTTEDIETLLTALESAFAGDES